MPWLILLYPFLVHAAVITDSRGLEWVALIVLVLNFLYAGLVRSALWAWLSLLAAIAFSAWFVLLGDGRYFLYTAPVLVCLAVAWLFGHTLTAGKVPLITRFARAMNPETLPAHVERYCFRVTQFWTLLLVALALVYALFAIFAPPVMWSWVTNFLGYLLLGVVFVGEWLFRRAYLGEKYALPWMEYFRSLIKMDYRRL